MKNTFKTTLILSVSLTIANICNAQVSDFTPLKYKYQSFKNYSFLPEIKLSLLDNRTYRHGALWYYPTKYKDEQVISIVQPNNTFDDTYFLNKKGELQYRSMAVTAPMNRYMNGQRFDSFNPTGARSIQEGIAQGLINMLFNKF